MAAPHHGDKAKREAALMMMSLPSSLCSRSTNLLQAAEVSSHVSQPQRQTAHQPQRCRQTAAGSQQLILKIERATHFFFFFFL